MFTCEGALVGQLGPWLPNITSAKCATLFTLSREAHPWTRPHPQASLVPRTHVICAWEGLWTRFLVSAQHRVAGSFLAALGLSSLASTSITHSLHAILTQMEVHSHAGPRAGFLTLARLRLRGLLFLLSSRS